MKDIFNVRERWSRRAFLGAAAAAGMRGAGAKKRSVLLIVVDDLRDWVGFMRGYRDVKTPHMDALRAKSVYFEAAYSAGADDESSRTALLTGRRPSTTGVYEDGLEWPAELAGRVTLTQQFLAHGYHVAGAGKIYAGTGGGKYWHETFDAVETGHKEQKAFGMGLAVDDATMADGVRVAWAEKQMAGAGGKPLFLACGLTGASAPWNAPQKYFDMYRVEDMRLGDVDETDLEDVAPLGRHFAKKVYRELGTDWTFSEIVKAGKWEEAARNYLACISHVDAQVGRLVAAWRASEHGKDGVVVLLSDHGWHLGEKLHWGAGTLWETATRVPLLIAAPGMAKEGGLCQRPVSLVDVYPTLNEICGLGRMEGLEGESLGHFLKKPGGKREKPAVMSWGKNSFALRSEQYRVIKYADGGVELYDIWSDPREKTNLALGPRHRQVVADQLRWAPEINAEPAAKRS